VADNLKLEPLEALERLDLRKSSTVGAIVMAMNQCSFGARMLGETALKIRDWIRQGRPIRVVYDGTPLRELLETMRRKGWIQEVVRSEAIPVLDPSGFEHLVIGRYSEAADSDIHRLAGAIAINKEELSRPGQVRDGYFPDAVFADPTFVVPVIYAALLEWIDGIPATVGDLFQELEKYPAGQRIVEGAATLHQMIADPGCMVFLTLSGAMTIAKMGLIICDMVDLGMVQVVSSTGALMAHGLIEGVGLLHYKHNPAHPDSFLAEHKLNRVTDTLEPEENFSHIEEIVDKVLQSFDGKDPISPSMFHDAVGKYLAEHFPHDRGILKSTFEKNVPVLCPAFVDSEIGNDLYVHNVRRKSEGRPPLIVWPELDSALLVQKMTGTPRAGIFSIGGGVPRNNTQNVAPLIEIANERLGLEMPTRMFSYGVRISPDAMHYGHLSGCTYSENGSWRKMDLENGRFAEIRADATQVWPFIVRYVMDRMK
jgi:deoxyhypusine synthase